MWISGFEKVMPEDRGFPRFIPRRGSTLSINFAAPTEPAKLNAILDPWRGQAHLHSEESSRDRKKGMVTAPHRTTPSGDAEEERKVRSLLTDVMQREVELLGHAVSGPLLSKAS